jgi:hypothetical protein
LLHDADAAVRFRAAQGLLAARDQATLPTLISLLQGAPLELSQRAEELLQCAAGDSLPPVTLGDSDTDRKQWAAAWSDWSKSNLEKLDLAQRDVSLPPSNINLRAKEVARRWIASLAKRDRSTWKKTSDSPFTLTMGSAFLEFNRREELDQLFQNAGTYHGEKMARMTFAVKDVVRLDQYLKSGMSREANQGIDEMTTFLTAGKLYL